MQQVRPMQPSRGSGWCWRYNRCPVCGEIEEAASQPVSDRLTPDREAEIRSAVAHGVTGNSVPLLLAEIDALRAERDALENHLNGAYIAANHPTISSEPIGCAVQRIVAGRDRLLEAATAVCRDGAGRSGGSVYLVHKQQFLALRVLVAEMDAAKGGTT